MFRCCPNHHLNQTQINITHIDGSMNVVNWDAWLQSVEAYFETQQFLDEEKIMIVEVHMDSQALTWWEADDRHCEVDNRPLF